MNKTEAKKFLTFKVGQKSKFELILRFNLAKFFSHQVGEKIVKNSFEYFRARASRAPRREYLEGFFSVDS